MSGYPSSRHYKIILCLSHADAYDLSKKFFAQDLRTKEVKNLVKGPTNFSALLISIPSQVCRFKFSKLCPPKETYTKFKDYYKKRRRKASSNIFRFMRPFLAKCLRQWILRCNLIWKLVVWNLTHTYSHIHIYSQKAAFANR